MSAKERSSDGASNELDEADEWSDADFARADQYDGRRLVKPGLGFDGLPKVKLEEVFVSQPVAKALAEIPSWQTQIEVFIRAWTEGRLRIAPLGERDGSGEQPEAAE